MKHIVIPAGGGGRGGGLGGGPGIGNLIADPTTAGRYSVMRTVSTPSPHYEVSTSNDDGTTWSDFVAVPATPDASSITKPWDPIFPRRRAGGDVARDLSRPNL